MANSPRGFALLGKPAVTHGRARGTRQKRSIEAVGGRMYEYFDHTADVGLRVRAATPGELFAEAARGFSGLIVADLSQVHPRETVAVELAHDAWDFLLFDWLNELLYLFESRRFVGCEFAVTVDELGLRARVIGEVLDPARHALEHEVKAVTYHGLRVAQEADGNWLAEVVLDI